VIRCSLFGLILTRTRRRRRIIMRHGREEHERHKKYMPTLQGKHLPFSPSPLLLNIFRLFVILSLTQLYRYTSEIFLFSTATFKYIYRASSDKLDKNSQRMWLIKNFSQWNGYNHFRFALDFSYAFGIL
jgi:hypothetical protein